LATTTAWLLLVYQLPTKRSPARVKVWRRLQRIGAVFVKNSAWVMPESDEAREDFEWLKAEIAASGGEAMVLLAHAPQAATQDELVAAFRTARTRDFDAIRKEASRLLERWTKRGAARSAGRALPQALRRLRERLRELEAIDHFGSPARDEAKQLVAQLERHARRGQPMKTTTETAQDTLQIKRYKHKVWVTRPRPGVDRMASAWLIRRAIDSKAAFTFRAKPRDTEIPFDMYTGDFGHHGELCTFETIAARFAVRDPAVMQIGQIVHDLDIKEARYNRPEAPAIGRLVEGLRQMHNDDAVLLEHGIEMFEALARSFS
jgi:hypothetical protein